MNKIDILKTFIYPWQVNENNVSLNRNGLLENNAPGTRMNWKRIMLGLPTWFNTIDLPQEQVDLFIFESVEEFLTEWWPFDHLNIPIWYIETKKKVLIIKVVCPRVNAIYTILIGDAKLKDIPNDSGIEPKDVSKFIKEIN